MPADDACLVADRGQSQGAAPPLQVPQIRQEPLASAGIQRPACRGEEVVEKLSSIHLNTPAQCSSALLFCASIQLTALPLRNGDGCMYSYQYIWQKFSWEARRLQDPPRTEADYTRGIELPEEPVAPSLSTLNLTSMPFTDAL